MVEAKIKELIQTIEEEVSFLSSSKRKEAENNINELNSLLNDSSKNEKEKQEQLTRIHNSFYGKDEKRADEKFNEMIDQQRMASNIILPLPQEKTTPEAPTTPKTSTTQKKPTQKQKRKETKKAKEDIKETYNFLVRLDMKYKDKIKIATNATSLSLNDYVQSLIIADLNKNEKKYKEIQKLMSELHL